MTALAIMCTLTDPELRERRGGVLAQFRAHVRAWEPHAHGYRFRFDPDAASMKVVFQVIELERQCCRFLRFQLTVEPNDGSILLAITGPEGTDAFLGSELGLTP